MINCFKCNKELPTYDEPEDTLRKPDSIGIVYDGLVFRATGNYGSTLFDPRPYDKELFLEIYVCDECCKNLIPVCR
jgi:hypothetical protein